MNNEQMLLNAAMAMGFENVQPLTKGGIWFTGKNGFDKFWNPLESSADCAEMEDALDISVERHDGMVTSIATDFYHQDKERDYCVFYKDHQNKSAARMYASTMVAARIGGKM